MNQEKIGKFIQENRKKKNLTQQELAEKLGISDRAVSKWERGINLPDASLLLELSKLFDVSINEILSGEKLEKNKYSEKLDENIINAINYSADKKNKENKRNAYILLIIGILISVAAFTLFKSDSSWGSVYSVIGSIISLIGVSKLTKKFKYNKRLLICLGYFAFYIIILLVLDFLGVILLEQAPRFAYLKEYGDNVIVYKAPFYDVYRINTDTDNEYYIVSKKNKYTMNTVPISPFNRNQSGIESIIKYESKYIGDNSNTSNLVHHLPLNNHIKDIEIDSENYGLIINYYPMSTEIDVYYLEKSLLYNSVSIFILIENINYITFNFEDMSYSITRDIAKEYPNYNILRNVKYIYENNFTDYLEEMMNDNEFILHFFKYLFIDKNLENTKKIVVKNSENIIKTIDDSNIINELIDLMENHTSILIGKPVNLDGTTINIDMINENDEVIYTFYVWTYRNGNTSYGIHGKEYSLVSAEANRFSEIIMN